MFRLANNSMEQTWPAHGWPSVYNLIAIDGNMEKTIACSHQEKTYLRTEIKLILGIYIM